MGPSTFGRDKTKAKNLADENGLFEGSTVDNPQLPNVYQDGANFRERKSIPQVTGGSVYVPAHRHITD
jgi:hypothetical protein